MRTPKEQKEIEAKRPGGFSPRHCSSPDPEIEKGNPMFGPGESPPVKPSVDEKIGGSE